MIPESEGKFIVIANLQWTQYRSITLVYLLSIVPFYLVMT